MSARLPWSAGTIPLMLAPMQGVTNRALRAYFIDRVRPDAVFTEFMQVSAQGGKGLTPADRREASVRHGGVPLVAQLNGHDGAALAAAARSAEKAGVRHLNLNLGCPYGRRTSGLTGGAMLSRPEKLPEVLRLLRDAIAGSFSVKLRAGYDDPRQIFSLLPLFEEIGVDFLILHPRTVVQKYEGRADHGVTARVARATPLPVIANGDINDAATGQLILEQTGAAGLMLGRGAIADPRLFLRLRGEAPDDLPLKERRRELGVYLEELATPYGALFCGNHQVLAKLKEVLAFIVHPGLAEEARAMKRTRSLEDFLGLARELRGKGAG